MSALFDHKRNGTLRDIIDNGKSHTEVPSLSNNVSVSTLKFIPSQKEAEKGSGKCFTL